MKLISHRGNLFGPNPTNENNPDYILNAIELGYDVEIDVGTLIKSYIWDMIMVNTK